MVGLLVWLGGAFGTAFAARGVWPEDRLGVLAALSVVLWFCIGKSANEWVHKRFPEFSRRWNGTG